MECESTVYIVDDDEASADSLEALLLCDGFAVIVYHSAEAFLDKYDQRRPACLVLDARLGGMSTKSDSNTKFWTSCKSFMVISSFLR